MGYWLSLMGQFRSADEFARRFGNDQMSDKQCAMANQSVSFFGFNRRWRDESISSSSGSGMRVKAIRIGA